MYKSKNISFAEKLLINLTIQVFLTISTTCFAANKVSLLIVHRNSCIHCNNLNTNFTNKYNTREFLQENNIEKIVTLDIEKPNEKNILYSIINTKKIEDTPNFVPVTFFVNSNLTEINKSCRIAGFSNINNYLKELKEKLSDPNCQPS